MRFLFITILSLPFFCPLYAQQHKLVHKRHSPHHPIVIIEPQPPYNIDSFVSKTLRYPETAKENNIRGRTIIRYLVDENGHMTHFEVLRGIGAGCDEQAMRLLKSIPPWKPGSYNGRPMRKVYIQAINFSFR